MVISHFNIIKKTCQHLLYAIMKGIILTANRKFLHFACRNSGTLFYIHNGAESKMVITYKYLFLLPFFEEITDFPSMP